MADIEIPQPNVTQTEAALVRNGDVKTIKTKTKNVKPEKTGKTIKGKAVKKELTFSEKLKKSFVKEDLKEVRDYIIFDVLIPSAKQSLLDMVIGAVSQTLGIPVRGLGLGRRTNGYSDNSIVDTGNRPFRNYAQSRQISNVSHERIRYDKNRVTDVIFEYKEDALSILEQMMDICDTYGWFSVFDFYDKAGITEGNDYVNRNYGWTNVDGVEVVFDGSGYIINLPRPRLR